jgi:hypothetical protein
MQQLIIVLVLCLLVSCRDATANSEDKKGSAVLIEMPPHGHRQYLDSLDIQPFDQAFAAFKGCSRFFSEEGKEDYILATDTSGNAIMRVDDRKVHLVKTGEKVEQGRLTAVSYSGHGYNLRLMVILERQVRDGVYEYKALLTIANKDLGFNVMLTGKLICV